MGRTLVRRKWSGQDVPRAASARELLAAGERPAPPGGRCSGRAAACPWRRGRACTGRGPRPARGARPAGSGSVTVWPNGCGVAALVDELLRGRDDLQGAGLALVARVAPGGDAVAAEDHADRLRVRLLDRGDVEAELEAGAPPRDPGDPVAEALAGQRLTVRRGRERDAGVGVQVVDVRGLDQAVHRGVDGRGGAALAERAEVERGDHLVLALDPRVDVDEGAQRVEPEHREARRGERAQVAARALHPQQLGRLPGDRVGRRALGGGVAAGVVGVLRVAAQPVGPGEQRARPPPAGLVSGVRALLASSSDQAPQPAAVPPTRSATIFSP